MEFYFLVLFSLYACYYTVMFGIKVWKNENKVGGIGIMVLAVSPVALSIFRLLFHD